MRVWIATLALSFLLLPSRGDADSLRCGNKLASDGATQTEVLMKCGEPTAKNSRTVAVSDKVKHKSEELDTTQQRVIYKTLEDWTYNFGPNRLIQVVTFEDGKLVKVESAGYGK